MIWKFTRLVFTEFFPMPLYDGFISHNFAGPAIPLLFRFIFPLLPQTFSFPAKFIDPQNHFITSIVFCAYSSDEISTWNSIWSSNTTSVYYVFYTLRRLFIFCNIFWSVYEFSTQRSCLVCNELSFNWEPCYHVNFQSSSFLQNFRIWLHSFLFFFDLSIGNQI